MPHAVMPLVARHAVLPTQRRQRDVAANAVQSTLASTAASGTHSRARPRGERGARQFSVHPQPKDGPLLDPDPLRREVCLSTLPLFKALDRPHDFCLVVLRQVSVER